uniref:Ketoreductase (KR) domain-containing protein n=1 Tax=Chromera velia CCMP2878 TaxID=1169474 RepID=A0A0G4F314_9ALVE|eukprot:Cvel_14834.t1-p1 / transcript=Cvel_14834.t1 / gene=Cvel_14834 / organism=Chromera_velia_CCMP2878 / gene_product=WW domain-containing oxidoreductase, putative / transcript_product=WW domain-containing oxidoreductase, putative / location=Cvel_scaffold1071:26947-28901(+) / protein_length=343 / sequence_SO=supercontig / SO=protein_coding / is_pseudo=false
MSQQPSVVPCKATIVITGSNVGLGFNLTKKILSEYPEWHIVMACRSAKKAEDAIEDLSKEGEGDSLKARLTYVELDLASLESAKAFPKKLLETMAEHALPPLACVCCNAGINDVMGGMKLTADGIEQHFQVNHLGHFALTVDLILQGALKASPSGEPPRVVLISSATHDPKQGTPVPSPQWTSAVEWAKKPPAPNRCYSSSKLCNVMFGYALHRKLVEAKEAGGPSVYIVDPGLMLETELARQAGFLKGVFTWVAGMIPSLSRHISSVDRSSSNIAQVCCSSSFNLPSGSYLHRATPTEAAESSEFSYDQEAQKDLWDTSLDLAGMRPSSPPAEKTLASLLLC